MATFTINFQANTTGVHHVGYRTYSDPVNVYTVVDVTVTSVGVQSVEIEVPENLYCAHSDVIYSGYVIAACQTQTDGDSNGIPDIALTWSVTLLQQTDPCIETEILCESVAIDSLTIDVPGSACTPDGVYPLTFTEVTPGDEVAAAVAEATITGGVMVSVNLIDPGLYKAAPTVSHSIGGCAEVPVISATLETICPSISLADYCCNTATDLSEDSVYTLSLGDTVTLCSDVSALASLDPNFATTQNSNCHCEACQNVTISALAATSGSGKVTYQTCWDATNPFGTLIMISRVINNGEEIDLGCILPNTLTIDEGDLDVSTSLTTVNCS